MIVKMVTATVVLHRGQKEAWLPLLISVSIILFSGPVVHIVHVNGCTWIYYCISRNFHEVFIFANSITNMKIKICEIYCLNSSMKSLYNWRHEKVTLPVWINAKLLNLEDLWSLHTMMIVTYSRQYITGNIFKGSHVIGDIDLFYDMIYSWLVSVKKKKNKPRDISNELFRWLMFGDNCKLTHWAYWL